MTCGTVENGHYLTTIPRQEGRLLDRLLRVEAWLDARRSRRMLYRLDSRGLADIGLTEADLGRADPTTSWHGLLVG
jgi:uncharacterized protein YjiS (DUF1127 family)